MSPSRQTPTHASALDAAAGIGAALCRSAYRGRDGRRCNWVGRSPDEVREAGGPVTPTAAALGPELYGGSSGVALFLAELHALSGDPDCRRTAAAAAWRSIDVVERGPGGPSAALSFFGGRLGVAFAAHRVAALTDDEALVARAEALLDTLADGLDAPHLLDVIGGNAGAIPALLALGRPRDVGLAVALGEELLSLAARDGDVWTWDAGKVAGPAVAPRLLTGLAHGASGLAVPLLELHAATGRGDFLEAARGAFAYEDALFDPDRSNWPDLRAHGASAGRAVPTAFATAWCHGAPGIALARVRAAALDPGARDAHLAVARAALDTTRTAALNALAFPNADASLCYGLSGLAEVLQVGGLSLDNRAFSGAAAEIADALVARHAGSGRWPSGLASRGPNPSLMLGVAGIGHFLLRQHAPYLVPPVLLLEDPITMSRLPSAARRRAGTGSIEVGSMLSHPTTISG
jgi:lantibiotic modifying enzyme